MSTVNGTECDNRRITRSYSFQADQLALSLQEIIDEAAERLGRSIALDDPQLRLLAHSAHYGDEDAGRVQSLLTRTITGALRAHVVGTGIHSWHEPGHLPAEASVAMAGRFCVPMHFEGVLQGFLWLIDDGSLDAGQLRIATEAGKLAAPLLGEANAARESQRVETAGAFLRLLSRTGSESDAGSLKRRLGPGNTYRVIVARMPGSGEPPWPSGERCQAAIRRTLGEPAGRRFHEPPVLAVYHGALAVLAPPAWFTDADPLDTFLARLRDCFSGLARQTNPDIGGQQVVIGGGGSCDPAGLADSHQQAEAACSALRHGESTAVWDGLGSRALLALLPRYSGDLSAIPLHLLPSPLRQLAQLDDPALAGLVETYLEVAGNVTLTATATHLHRSTVYAKLEQFETRIGARLDSGDVRLMLHVWMVHQRLAGP